MILYKFYTFLLGQKVPVFCSIDNCWLAGKTGGATKKQKFVGNGGIPGFMYDHVVVRYQLDGYCLAILFSSRVFGKHVLGLSWQGGPVPK